MKIEMAPAFQAERERGPAKITLYYYTDPDCSWCWATEPIIKKIKEEYNGQVRMVYKMGGLLDSWENFYDAAHDIGRPDQVGPHWVDVARRSGMPIDEAIWHEDPPLSTYPGCIAFKAAELQDRKTAESYLRRLREAVLTERKNISKEPVLFQLAAEVGLDMDRFREDFLTGPARQVFNDDLRETRSRGITGFPTMVIANFLGQEIMIVGWRPYAHYEDAMRRLATEDLHKMPLMPLVDFVRKYGHVATQEVATVYEMDREAALAELERLAETRQIVKELKAGGEFWMPKLG